MAKSFATEMAQRAVDDAVQLIGGRGRAGRSPGGPPVPRGAGAPDLRGDDGDPAADHRGRAAEVRRLAFHATMWHPEPFVKHPIPATHPPTAEEAARSLWFSPLRSGRLELAERTWVPAMVPWRATDDGLVTPEVLAWYERFARGQPGALVVEATGIRDIPSGPLLRIGHDRFIPGLAELVRTVRQASGGRTRLFIQIIDFLRIRRRPEPGAILPGVPGAHRPAPRPAARQRRRHPRRAGAIAGGGVARLPRRAGAREPAIRRAGAGHRHRAAAHPGAAAGTAGARSLERRHARSRPASMAWSCTTPTPTPWRRFSPR